MTIRTPQQQHDLEHDRPELVVEACPACRYERRRCGEKARFPDRDSANTRGHQVNVETDWTLRLVAYPCPWCRGFHLTKAKPGTARWRRTEKRRLEWLAERESITNLLAGARVLSSPYLTDGAILRIRVPVDTVVIGTRPLTDLEFAAAEARYWVRQGLADVLAWCGREVGPPPVRRGRGKQMLARLKATHVPVVTDRTGDPA